MTSHRDGTILSPMPSNKDKFTLRFRTKKQAAEFRRLAKTEHFSLNEFILRTLENTIYRFTPRVEQAQQTSVDN